MFKELFTEISERKILSMKYTTMKNKEIVIFYELLGSKKAQFKVPQRDATRDIDPEMSDVLTVTKDKRADKFDPELEIFNYLRGMDY